MDERELRELIAEVKDGRLSRRAFVQQMIAVGLTAPIAGMMLSQSGVAFAASEIPYKPTKAGGGGALKLLLWQAPTLLNPHFAVGVKDQEACRVFYEPLAGWDSDGNLVPVLAAEIPSKDNDGLKEDGLSVVWKLKQGVKWHDGTHVYRRRRRLQLGVRAQSGHRGRHHRQLQGHQGREDRRSHDPCDLRSSRRRSGPTPLSASTA